VTTRSTFTRHRRIWGFAALLAGLAVILSACSSATPGNQGSSVAAPSTSPSSTASTTAPAPAQGASTSKAAVKPTVATGAPVHVRTELWDGEQVGVGMPVIFYFSKQITEAKTLQDLTKVTVNGKPVVAAWYFETSDANKGYPIEAHLRTQTYWPAHSEIHVSAPMKGQSAGPGLVFDDSLSINFATGAENILTVNDATHAMNWISDGKQMGVFPVSLGASDTPTARGIKVIMEKGASICMHGPGYNICGVKYTQRLTYGGEYLHAAPWNKRIGEVDSSNGCTNLNTADAKTLYAALEIGDVVNYPNANGPKMQLGDGYGDWNVTWPLWQTGGLVSTT
jgi:lipoprotein-anchoring transpeptidase ErfK/SrfK